MMSIHSCFTTRDEFAVGSRCSSSACSASIDVGELSSDVPRWRAAEIMCPPALRPGMVILLAMLAAPGVSVLRNTYVINRGYEELYSRLNALGANIQTFRDI